MDFELITLTAAIIGLPILFGVAVLQDRLARKKDLVCLEQLRDLFGGTLDPKTFTLSGMSVEGMRASHKITHEIKGRNLYTRWEMTFRSPAFDGITLGVNPEFRRVKLERKDRHRHPEVDADGMLPLPFITSSSRAFCKTPTFAFNVRWREAWHWIICAEEPRAPQTHLDTDLIQLSIKEGTCTIEHAFYSESDSRKLARAAIQATQHGDIAIAHRLKQCFATAPQGFFEERLEWCSPATPKELRRASCEGLLSTGDAPIRERMAHLLLHQEEADVSLELIAKYLPQASFAKLPVPRQLVLCGHVLDLLSRNQYQNIEPILLPLLGQVSSGIAPESISALFYEDAQNLMGLMCLLPRWSQSPEGGEVVARELVKIWPDLELAHQQLALTQLARRAQPAFHEVIDALPQARLLAPQLLSLLKALAREDVAEPARARAIEKIARMAVSSHDASHRSQCESALRLLARPADIGGLRALALRHESIRALLGEVLARHGVDAAGAISMAQEHHTSGGLSLTSASAGGLTQAQPDGAPE